MKSQHPLSLKSLVAALAGTAVLGAADVSATLQFPANVTGNAQTGSDVADSDVFNLISGVGLSAVPLDETEALTVTHSGIFTAPSSHWVTNAPNGGSVSYFPHPDGIDPELTFDMGGIVSVGSMFAWGYTGGGFAAGGNTPSQAVFEFFVGGVSQGTEVIQFPSLPPNPAGPSVLGDTGPLGGAAIGFGQAYSADTIVMTLTATHGNGDSLDLPGDSDDSDDHLSGGDRVGLGEIIFSDGVVPNSFTPGDTDGDGDIDDSDLGTAFSNYTGPQASSQGLSGGNGDTDGDGDVDDSDLGTAFSGYTGPLGPASVPEPTSLALLGLGGLLCVRRRRASL